MATIPTPTVYRLSPEVTDQFDQNGKFDMVLTMKDDGSFDIYLRNKRDPENSNNYFRPDIAIKTEDGSKPEQLLDEYTGDFQPVNSSNRTDKLARIKEILDDRVTKNESDLIWRTLEPKPGIEHSKCGMMCGFGTWWVTP